MRTIKILSRASALAVRQAELVIEDIRRFDPSLSFELLTLKTTGDMILNMTLDKVGGKGLFVKEIDAALLAGVGDISVHSLKDMPVDNDARLPIAAFSKRADPYDALVLPIGVSEPDPVRPIGCSSQRRAIQLKKLFPEWRIEPIRGNVQTRLDKLARGEYSSLVLAAAGLKRLKLEDRISRLFTPDEMLPAAGQGVIAVQTRAGTDTSFLRIFHDEESANCARAERAFMAELGANCFTPAGAFAELVNETFTLRGMIECDGELRFGRKILKIGDIENAARALARELRRDGYNDRQDYTGGSRAGRNGPHDFTGM